MGLEFDFYRYLLLLSLFDISAILFARYYTETQKTRYCFISLVSFAISAYLMVRLMAFRDTAIINVLYISFSTVFITLVCYFLFKEKINFFQVVGILMVIFGIVAMEFS